MMKANGENLKNPQTNLIFCKLHTKNVTAKRSSGGTSQPKKNKYQREKKN